MRYARSDFGLATSGEIIANEKRDSTARRGVQLRLSSPILAMALNML